MGMDPALADELGGRILAGAREVLGDHLAAAVVMGSAINGDFFPYYSDFDIHLYVAPGAMRGFRALRPDLAFRFQASMADFDPEAYGVSQAQVIFIQAGAHPADWTPLVPGTYRLIDGTLPPGATSGDDALLVRTARAALPALDGWVDNLLERLVDKPDGSLAGPVRLTGTILKPSLRQAATLLGAPPVGVWSWPLRAVLELVEPAAIPGEAASGYFTGAAEWREVRDDGPALRAMGALGIRALEALAEFGQRQLERG